MRPFNHWANERDADYLRGTREDGIGLEGRLRLTASGAWFAGNMVRALSGSPKVRSSRSSAATIA